MDVIRCGPCLAPSAYDGLLAPFLGDDIKSALFSIGNDKGPGPDGYFAFFFKKAWDIVGIDFVLAIQNFFISEKMLKQINHFIIALILKSANVSYPSDFRSISCCNVIYKVIYKLLSGKLAHVLSDIISSMHNAFWGGRKMADNIFLV